MNNTADIILFNEQKIAAYDEFRAQLSELKEGNNKAVFDYEDPKGNKEARSHIYKLRQTKSAVDRVRKEQKQASLDYGRRVDAQAKEIMTEIEQMIDVHQKPIDEIEQREKDRVAAHHAKLEELQSYLDPSHAEMSSGIINSYWHDLEALEPTEAFQEFMAPAMTIYKNAMNYLKDCHEKASKREAEQAELERLRAEQQERERAEREARIAAEAAEKARIEAETRAKAEAEAVARKAQEEREAAARREAEARAAAERAEQARIAAEAKAKRDAEEAEKRQAEAVKAAEDRAKREAEQARLDEEAAAQKREANKKHMAKINNAAVTALVAGGMNQDQAKMAVTLIAQRQIPAVSISY